MRGIARALAPIVIVASLVRPAVAAGANWTLVTTSKSDVRVYIDPQTIVRDGDTAVALMKWDFTDAKPDPERPYLTEIDKIRYDCSAKTTFMLTAVEYNADGGVRKSYDFADTPQKPEKVDPDSIAEALLDFACDTSAGT